MRNPFFYLFRPPILAPKIDQTNMFLSPPFLDFILLILFGFFWKWSIWRLLQNPVGAKTRPRIDQVPLTWPNQTYLAGIFLLRRNPIHAETQSGLDRRFIFFLHFTNLAAQLSTNHLSFILFGMAKYMQKHRADRPYKIQWDQVAPQCLQHIVQRSPFCCPEFLYPLVHFGCSFGTLSVPIRSLWHDFQSFFATRFCQYRAKK